MSANELIQYTSDVVFVLIFLVVLRRAIKRPRRSHIDAALFFGAAAAIVVESVMLKALAIQAPAWLGVVVVGLLLALPFLTLRLVNDLTGLPKLVLPSAFAGWIIATTAFALAPREALLPITLVIVAYFAVCETYGAVVVFRASRRATGIVRPRLGAIALGTAMLGAAIGAVGLIVLVPQLSFATNVLALASALAYYVGFSTPHFLRRSWAEPELRAFMTQALQRSLGSPDDLARQMAHLVRTALGADVAAVGVWNEERQMLRFQVTDGQISEVPPIEAAAGPAFVQQRAMVRIEDRNGTTFPDRARAMSLRSVLAAPISFGETRYGVLAAYAFRAPLFAEEDLELVEILAKQLALILRNQDLFGEVRELNSELEQRVAEVNATNEELASFAYAVSHDLRAPLRAIDGFSEILIDEKSAVLGDDGREHLGRIRRAAQNMGQLIDDLLQLSRTGRAELHLMPIDLSGLARRVAAEHAEREPERSVAFRAVDGLRAAGDEGLLRVVLDNLIGNAFKFTRPVKQPSIELGVTNGSGPKAFFVRDNGVGFDQTYQAKLFTPFQRLHSPREFEGNGIGLATVRRVIRRHGGDVWAESTPGEGATFFFTLPSA